MPNVPEYRVILEDAGSNWGAHSPDVPGCCIATGATRDEAFENYKAALAFHLEGVREAGGEVPESYTLRRA